MENHTKSYQFCLGILQLGVRNNKALANTVMALSTNMGAKSPVELSTLPVFHYQNISVSKSITRLATSEQSWSSVAQDVQYLVQLHVSRQMIEQPVLHLQTDTTPVRHPHSPTLEGKTYIYVPNNRVAGNKPLSIGYQVSAIHIGESQSQWSLPLSMRRVRTDQSAIAYAVGQIDQLFDSQTGILPLREGQLVLNDADTGYAHPAYVAPLHRHEDLVNIVRLRSGSKIWDAAPLSDTGGAPKKATICTTSRSIFFMPKCGIPKAANRCTKTLSGSAWRASERTRFLPKWRMKATATAMILNLLFALRNNL